MSNGTQKLECRFGISSVLYIIPYFGYFNIVRTP